LTYPELADIERCCDFEYPPLEELETIQELWCKNPINYRYIIAYQTIHVMFGIPWYRSGPSQYFSTDSWDVIRWSLVRCIYLFVCSSVHLSESLGQSTGSIQFNGVMFECYRVSGWSSNIRPQNKNFRVHRFIRLSLRISLPPPFHRRS
jgi:hypothetical protein